MTELLAKRKRKSSPSTPPSSVRKKPRLDALDTRSLTTTPCELLEDELRQKYPLATSHVLRDKEDDADEKFDTNSESYTQDSTLMSTMLRKMGYSDTNRHRTKELLLLLNECNNIFERALNDGIPRCYFSVGSQIECTSLPDSDDDNLFGPSNEHVAAISSQRYIKDGRVNILMVRNGMSSPGHVWLKHLDIKQSQLISKCTRLKSETKDRIDMQVKLYSQCYIPIAKVPDVDKHLLCTWPGTLFLDDTDMLFYIPNSLYTLIGKQMWAGKASRTGPSFSSSETDVVRPIFCDYVFPSDQDPLTIGGKLYGNLHVPNKYPCNLVPVGHPESEDSMLEWRISYNLTEREIMFGLNITHIHTYVVLKMLQRNFKHVKNNLTSYHFKTSLYFTIATTTPTMWREDNLINCVRQCLKMIRMFLKKKFCSHFFNKAFNIFAGKLSRCGKHWDMLIKLVDDYVDNPSSIVEGIKQANKRINRIQSVPLETRRFVLNSITLVEQVNKTIVDSAVTPFTQLGNLAPHIRPVDIQKTRFMYGKLRKKLENQIEHLPTGEDNKCAKVVLSFVIVRDYLLSVADLMEQGKTPALLSRGTILPDALSMDLQMSSVLFVNGKFEQSLLFLDRVFKKNCK
ncbi:uncharacterized protein LOC128239341 [Mya arenaria]|uniref:uncharacterized protein LOC128239341 n=1 Tax=Mya arenaria TaxID=6604 RepID=UPI0022E413F8|nr:uncharacterized protein LOC128239341 [Mya arenaria]